VPKFRAKPELKLVEKRWSCPGCGAPIETSFNGELVEFTYEGKVFSMGGGIYEFVEVVCPSCGGFISFTRKELEVQGS